MRSPAILELRQYTLKPGCRDELIELFEREFVASQEALGITLPGRFRDLDDPDRFIWLRGFNDMDARREALEAFYGGPVWSAHRAAANATMIDSDNVLLLRPLDADNLEPRLGGKGSGLLVLSVLDAEAAPDIARRFETRALPALVLAGADLLGRWVSELSENTYPRLPVREGETVFAWLARFPDQAAYAAFLAAGAEGGKVAVMQRIRLGEVG